MLTKILVKYGSGNSLLPDGTKALPEQMLTYHHDQPGSRAFINTQVSKAKVMHEIYIF